MMKPLVSTYNYRDNGNGTVSDVSTGLMWKQCSEGQSGKDCRKGKAAKYGWDDAMSKFGKGISFAGYDDWRIPTKDELRTLVYCDNGTSQATAWDKGCGDNYQRPTIDLKAFPNTLDEFYWSFTAKGASGAWHVNFDFGADGWNDRNAVERVRLVRSGQ